MIMKTVFIDQKKRSIKLSRKMLKRKPLSANFCFEDNLITNCKAAKAQLFEHNIYYYYDKLTAWPNRIQASNSLPWRPFSKSGSIIEAQCCVAMETTYS